MSPVAPMPWAGAVGDERVEVLGDRAFRRALHDQSVRLRSNFDELDEVLEPHAASRGREDGDRANSHELSRA